MYGQEVVAQTYNKFNSNRYSKCCRLYTCNTIAVEINVNSGNIEINSGSIIEASAIATDGRCTVWRPR